MYMVNICFHNINFKIRIFAMLQNLIALNHRHISLYALRYLSTKNKMAFEML